MTSGSASVVRFDDSTFGYHSDASIIATPHGGGGGGGGRMQGILKQQQQQQQQQDGEVLQDEGRNNSTIAQPQQGKHEVILAVHLHPQTMTLGAAAYDAETGALTLCPDFKENINFEFLGQLMKEKEPTSLLVSAKLSEAVSAKLAAIVTSNGLQDMTTMQVKPSRDFDYDLALTRIRETELPAANVKRASAFQLADKQLGGNLRTCACMPFATPCLRSSLPS